LKSLIRFLLRSLASVLFRVRFSGNVEQFQAKKLLIIANHESYLDGLLLGLFLPVNPVFVVHTGVAGNFWFSLILKLVDYLAVDPTSPMAMKTIIKETQI
jgi:acyl-[acyl-carrier-protein]-phospholipid O-acyltransferase / long-chain-fatty-acid--[acyl-carrier-protein] ligase